MNSTLKILLIIVAVILLIMAGYFLLYNKTTITPNSTTNPSLNNQTTFPKDENKVNFSTPSKDASKMTLQVGNEKIETNNLYKNPVETFPGNEVAFAENKQYHMLFYPKNEGFIIVILDRDIQAGRDKAENDFLTTLGITKDQACKLTVDLGTIYSVNPAAAGKNYGLSFCPNGKPFPKN